MPVKIIKNKAFSVVEAMIVVIIIGILAAFAIPAFQKVHSSSQDKAVLNNARQLAAASEQYFFENSVHSVSFVDLIGTKRYVKAFVVVAGESYPQRFERGETITITGVAGCRTVTYSP